MDGIELFTTPGVWKWHSAALLVEAKTEETQKTLADEQAKVQALTQEQRGEVGCHLGKICQDQLEDRPNKVVSLASDQSLLSLC